MRKLTYNTTRFDGGMTSSPRDVTQRDRFAYLSHFDIYRDTGKMYVMPGYVDDMSIGGDADGMKAYDIQAFNTTVSPDRIYALGKKTDGTGSKLFWRIYTGTEWEVPSGGSSSWAVEGTADLVSYPFLHYINPEFYYPVRDTDGSGTWIAELGPSAIAGQDDDWQTWDANTTFNSRVKLKQVFTGSFYISQYDTTGGLSLLTSSALTVNTLPSGLFIGDFVSGNYQIGMLGLLISPRRGQVVLRDSASLLADENIAVGKGNPVVIGYPSNIWATVMVTSATGSETNGKSQMTVRLLSGETPEAFYILNAIGTIDQTTDIFSLNDKYQDSMLWYAKPEVATGVYNQGIWALGKGDINSRMGVSVLLDTTSLGLVRNAHVNGNSIYFIHGGDGSISRLDNFDTGTYDVPATAETVWYGNETPYQKELNGITVVTSPLPASASVQMYYRTNDSASWTSMGTSSTVGSMKHTFSKVAGIPIGKFQEIQFKFVVTGKVSVQNMFINITETDDLSY